MSILLERHLAGAVGTIEARRGICFSVPLVPKVMDGSKTHTRRLVKPPVRWGVDASGRRCGRMEYDLRRATIDHGFPSNEAGELAEGWPDPEFFAKHPELYRYWYLHVPYRHPHDRWDPDGGDARERVYAPWEPGEALWVREAHSILDMRPEVADFEQAKRPTGPWKAAVTYVADDRQRLLKVDPESWRESYDSDEIRVRSGRFLPRWAARTAIRVDRVRVERLQDISGPDAIAEGMTPAKCEEVFRRAAGARLAEPAECHHLYFDQENRDSEADWCPRHIHAAQHKHGGCIRRDLRRETDCPVRCEACGRVLEHELSVYGAECEILLRHELFPGVDAPDDESWKKCAVVSGHDATILANLAMHICYSEGSWPKAIKERLAQFAFATTWEHLHGKGSWELNELVWVNQFALLAVGGGD